MSVDLTGFDASTVEPNRGFQPIPNGDYLAVIIKAERKDTSNRDGALVALQIEVLEGEHKGARLFDNLNLWNKSDKAVQIAQGTLSAICRAVDVLTPKSTDELLNKPLMVTVGQETYNGKVKNTVEKYSGRDNAVGSGVDGARETAVDPGNTPSFMRR